MSRFAGLDTKKTLGLRRKPVDPKAEVGPVQLSSYCSSSFTPPRGPVPRLGQPIDGPSRMTQMLRRSVEIEEKLPSKSKAFGLRRENTVLYQPLVDMTSPWFDPLFNRALYCRLTSRNGTAPKGGLSKLIS